MDIAEVAIVGAIIGIVGLIGYTIHDELTAETVELRKDQWRCTESRTELAYMQQVGKVMIPQYRNSCLKYERNAS